MIMPITSTSMASKGNRRGGFASTGSPQSPIQGSVDGRLDLGDLEGLAGDLGDRPGIDQILVAEQGLELTLVHFRYDDPVIRLWKFAQIRRQRPDVTEMDVADVLAVAARAADG